MRSDTIHALADEVFTHLPDDLLEQACTALATELQTHRCWLYWSHAVDPTTGERGPQQRWIEHKSTCPHHASAGQFEPMVAWEQRRLEEQLREAQAHARTASIEAMAADGQLEGPPLRFLLDKARSGAPVEAYRSAHGWNVWIHGSRVTVAEFAQRYTDAETQPLLEQLLDLTTRHPDAAVQIVQACPSLGEGEVDSASPETWHVTFVGWDNTARTYVAEEQPTAAQAYAHALAQARRMISQSGV